MNECDAATQAANIAKLKGRCFTCAGEHATKNCSYPRTVICNKCSKPGHLARCCIKSGPISLPERARQVQEDDREDDSSRQDMADAGCTVTILSARLAAANQLRLRTSTNIQLKAANSSLMKVNGELILTVTTAIEPVTATIHACLLYTSPSPRDS